VNQIFRPKLTHALQQRRFRRISASAVRASEKCSIIPNRNTTTSFPTSYRWSPYVTPNSPEGWLKKGICHLKQIPLYFRNSWSQRLQIWYATGVCQGPSSNLTRRKSECGPGLGSSRNFGLPFNISARAEASDFEFGIQLGLPRPTIKSHPEKKVWVA